MFKNAIVRRPGASFAGGLTTSGLGPPDLPEALRQHQRYCEALEACGLSLTRLEPDTDFPDSPFVEDTAVLTAGQAILARPGAESRRGEVDAIGEVIRGFYREVRSIDAPGTLDGGDICEAGTHFFIGVSHRTNAEGARQLAGFLADEGITSGTVDIRSVPGLLHLKSGMGYLGDHRLLLVGALAGHEGFRGYGILEVPEGEEYAGNCVRVNDEVFLAEGFPRTTAALVGCGYRVRCLEMSEYRKMDGGLSCLSLRF